MSSIDLAVLGMVLERPQSAYELQKDVAYHHFSRWTRISVPSVYKKVLQLAEKGYLKSEAVKGNRFSEKTVYSITEQGRKRFIDLMEACADRPVPLLFDFNVVVANLNKVDQGEALALIQKLRGSIAASAEEAEGYAADYPGLPLVGRTIFDQQRLLYRSLLQWLDEFTAQFDAQS